MKVKTNSNNKQEMNNKQINKINKNFISVKRINSKKGKPTSKNGSHYKKCKINQILSNSCISNSNFLGKKMLNYKSFPNNAIQKHKKNNSVEMTKTKIRNKSMINDIRTENKRINSYKDLKKKSPVCRLCYINNDLIEKKFSNNLDEKKSLYKNKFVNSSNSTAFSLSDNNNSPKTHTRHKVEYSNDSIKLNYNSSVNEFYSFDEKISKKQDYNVNENYCANDINNDNHKKEKNEEENIDNKIYLIRNNTALLTFGNSINENSSLNDSFSNQFNKYISELNAQEINNINKNNNISITNKYFMKLKKENESLKNELKKTNAKINLLENKLDNLIEEKIFYSVKTHKTSSCSKLHSKSNYFNYKKKIKEFNGIYKKKQDFKNNVFNKDSIISHKIIKPIKTISFIGNKAKKNMEVKIIGNNYNDKKNHITKKAICIKNKKPESSYLYSLPNSTNRGLKNGKLNTKRYYYEYNNQIHTIVSGK